MEAYPVIYIVSFFYCLFRKGCFQNPVVLFTSNLTDNGQNSVTKLEFKQRLSVAIGAAKGKYLLCLFLQYDQIGLGYLST